MPPHSHSYKLRSKAKKKRVSRSKNAPVKHKNLRNIQWLIDILGDQDVLTHIFKIPESQQDYMPPGHKRPTKKGMYYVDDEECIQRFGKECKQRFGRQECFDCHWYAYKGKKWFDSFTSGCQKEMTNQFCQLFAALYYKKDFKCTKEKFTENAKVALREFLKLLQPHHLKYINNVLVKKDQFHSMTKFKEEIAYIIQNMDDVLKYNE